MAALLGIDFGTTTLKAVVFDEHGRRLGSASVEPPGARRVIGGCEAEIWPAEPLWERTCELLRRCTADLTVPVDGVALVELGLVGMPILADGTAGYPAVAWINPPDPLAAMRHDLDGHTVFAVTGNRVNPIYPPAWISWLREHDPEYPTDMSAWVYAGDHIVSRLCGEIGVDYSMASQSTVFDQRTFGYRADLLSAYGLGPDTFPPPSQSGTRLGEVTAAAAAATGLAAGTPVMVGGADFVAGAYGSGLIDPGQAAIITGTWECTVMCSERPETGPALEKCGAICDPHVAPGGGACGSRTSPATSPSGTANSSTSSRSAAPRCPGATWSTMPGRLRAAPAAWCSRPTCSELWAGARRARPGGVYRPDNTPPGPTSPGRCTRGCAIRAATPSRRSQQG